MSSYKYIRFVLSSIFFYFIFLNLVSKTKWGSARISLLRESQMSSDIRNSGRRFMKIYNLNIDLVSHDSEATDLAPCDEPANNYSSWNSQSKWFLWKRQSRTKKHISINIISESNDSMFVMNVGSNFMVETYECGGILLAQLFCKKTEKPLLLIFFV